MRINASNVCLAVLLLLGTFAETKADTIYASTNGALYTVNPATGASTLLSNGPTMYDIAWNPSGTTLWGVDATGNKFYTINPLSGAATLVGSAGVNIFINGLEFRADGTLFASGSQQIYTINLGTGAATALPNPTGGATSAGDLAFDNDGVLYLAGTNGIYKVNDVTGVAMLLGAPSFNDIFGLAFANGVLYGMSASSNNIFVINTTNGTSSLAQNLNPSFSTNGASVRLAEVPEPASMALWSVLSVAGLAAWRRRRAMAA